MHTLYQSTSLPSINSVAEVAFEMCFSLPPVDLGDAFDLGLAECIEAIHEGHANVDLGG